MKHVYGALLGATALLLSSPSFAETTLTIATVNNSDMIRMQGLTSEFTAKNPDITVKWVTLEENVLRQRVTTDIATKGGQFDVLTIGTYEVPIWAKKNWLVPLSNLGADYDVGDLLPKIRDAVSVDGKQIERAISNLLLNACQSARAVGAAATVVVTLESQEREMIISVIDNGPGVPGRIRESLFDPFVSEGKQKGTGLGLTLAYCIALEHGGEVVLVSSRPGETIFQMKVARGLSAQDGANASESECDEQVIPDENLRT